MKIAVTGGSGFIGSRLVKKLTDMGHQVVVIDLMEPSTKSDIEVKIADVMDLQQMKSALKGVDVVYHLVGMVVNTTRKNPYKAVLLHSGGTVNVLEACRANGVKKILYASTFYVYDGISEKIVVNEETPLNILSMELFGSTKLLGEAILKDYSRKYGLEYVILRFGSAYGTGGCSNVVLTFIDFGLKDEPIEIWGEGKRRNQYTYVDDIAEGCVLAMNKTNEIYNLISPEETATGELAELLKRKYGFEVVYNPIQKEGPSMSYMSSRKAILELGWKPTPLEKGIDKIMSEIKGRYKARKAKCHSNSES